MKKLNRFNWIAKKYDTIVDIIFGQTLHNAQLHFADIINTNDNVLILGGGSGKFLEALLKLKPSTNITYIDASSEMIALAESRISKHLNVLFIHGTQENIPSRYFDVVITNFFLDLFPDDAVGGVVTRIATSIRSGGHWIITDFEKTSKITHRFLLMSMYLFFRVTGSVDAKALPDWISHLRSKRLILHDQVSFKKGFIKSSLFVKA